MSEFQDAEDWDAIMEQNDQDYEPDGSPKRRMPASMKNWWPDADAADPPDREE